jgi:hypothetical protein
MGELRARVSDPPSVMVSILFSVFRRAPAMGRKLSGASYKMLDFPQVLRGASLRD